MDAAVGSEHDIGGGCDGFMDGGSCFSVGRGGLGGDVDGVWLVVGGGEEGVGGLYVLPCWKWLGKGRSDTEWEIGVW